MIVRLGENFTIGFKEMLPIERYCFMVASDAELLI